MKKATFKSKAFGGALIEMMVTAGIVAVGLLGLTMMQGKINKSKMDAKQHSEAIVIAQDKMEDLRMFTVIPTTTGETAYDDIGTSSDTVYGQNATYTRTWTMSESTDPDYKTISMDITWTDSAGVGQSVNLISHISGVNPAASGLVMASEPQFGSGSVQPPDPNANNAEDGGNVDDTPTDDETPVGEEPPAEEEGGGDPQPCDDNSRHANIPDGATNNCDGTSTYTNNGKVLTYNNGSGKITKINGYTAAYISGTVNIGTGGYAPSPGIDLSDVGITISPSTNTLCTYIGASGAYECVVGGDGGGWSGSIILNGFTNANVCRNYDNYSYTHVSGTENSQNFQIIKQSKSCTGSYPHLHQDL